MHGSGLRAQAAWMPKSDNAAAKIKRAVLSGALYMFPHVVGNNPVPWGYFFDANDTCPETW